MKKLLSVFRRNKFDNLIVTKPYGEQLREPSSKDLKNVRELLKETDDEHPDLILQSTHEKVTDWSLSVFKGGRMRLQDVEKGKEFYEINVAENKLSDVFLQLAEMLNNGELKEILKEFNWKNMKY